MVVFFQQKATWALAISGALAGFLFFGFAQTPALPKVHAQDPATVAGDTQAGPRQRNPMGGRESVQREGTETGRWTGEFAEVGRRWVFRVDGSQSNYVVLENLTLQRVVTNMRHDAEDNRWTIEGTLTEFDDTNYLLLRWSVRAGGEHAEVSTNAT